MDNKVMGEISHEAVVDLLNLINKLDTEGNKASGLKLKQIIIEYVQDRLKTVVDRLERQYNKLEIHLSQTIKEDIIIAIIAQYMAEDMQYAYDFEMDAKTVAITLDTSNVAGVSGYSDEVTSAGYKRSRSVDELSVLELSEKANFKEVLDEQIESDNEKGLVKANFKDNTSKGGKEGYFYGSHAERELSHRTNRPIGVSRRMCNQCVNYFRNLHSLRIVADSDFIWIFEADGSIKTLLNNGSMKQLNSKMRNFYKKYGKC